LQLFLNSETINDKLKSKTNNHSLAVRPSRVGALTQSPDGNYNKMQ